MIQAFIQHSHKNSGKMVLQALIPFVDLVNVVLFTCKANPKGSAAVNKQSVAKENFEYYQRRIDTSRIRKIEDFIQESILSEEYNYSITALFPSALILAINEDDGNVISCQNEISCTIDLKENIFIVDGQHRMMAMKSLYDKLNGALLHTKEDEVILNYLRNYKFNCVLLVNYDLWEQGQVFVNVNFKQKAVNKSLYYEIFGSDYNENPIMWKQNHVYLAHSLTKILNSNDASPYKGHVKMLGTGKGYVSQAFLVEAIMKHFALDGIWSVYKKKIDKDSDIRYMAVELISFFAAVYDVFRHYWPKADVAEEEKGTIICKTTGTGAFLRLMKDIHELAPKEVIDSLYNISIGISNLYFNHVKDQLSKITKSQTERFFGKTSKYYGSSGKGSEVNMYRDLKLAINKNKDSDKHINSTIPEDVVAEELQEYLWMNQLSELDCLGNRYEFEDLSDFQMDIEASGDKYFKCKVSFESGVTIYMDSDDVTGYTMSFPSEATLTMRRKGDKWILDESTIKISVDTTKYYT